MRALLLRALALLLCGSLVFAVGCGDDSGDDDDDTTDGGGDDDDDYMGPVQIHGVIMLEGDPQQPGASVRVSLVSATGDEIDNAMTNGDGEYTLDAPSAMMAFIRAEPKGMHGGIVRPEMVRGMSYEPDPATMPALSGLMRVAMDGGFEYDETKASLVVGFNPSPRAMGGDGATLSAASSPGLNVTADSAIQSNTLVPICEGSPPTCAPMTRLPNIFFLNVEGSTTTVTLTSGTGTCNFRTPVMPWRLYPNTITNIIVDCM